MPPVILGLILGPTIEKNLQSAGPFGWQLFHFLHASISCVLIVVRWFSLMLPLITYFVKKKQGKNRRSRCNKRGNTL